VHARPEPDMHTRGVSDSYFQAAVAMKNRPSTRGVQSRFLAMPYWTFRV
jgi:hypothetical protein